MTYFPPSPVPLWPYRSRTGARLLSEAIAERKLLHYSGDQWNAESARVRSRLYRNGEPMICASCGAKTDGNGKLPCGH